MSKVRVLVGTRKGAFILTSDGTREKWEISGPHFAGWEIYHMKGSPAEPTRIYVSQTSGWVGQIIQRSDDGGKTRHQPAVAARCGRHVPAHHHSRSGQSTANMDRHFCRGSIPHRRWRQNLEADQQRPALPIHS